MAAAYVDMTAEICLFAFAFATLLIKNTESPACACGCTCGHKHKISASFVEDATEPQKSITSPPANLDTSPAPLDEQKSHLENGKRNLDREVASVARPTGSIAPVEPAGAIRMPISSPAHARAWDNPSSVYVPVNNDWKDGTSKKGEVRPDFANAAIQDKYVRDDEPQMMKAEDVWESQPRPQPVREFIREEPTAEYSRTSTIISRPLPPHLDRSSDNTNNYDYDYRSSFSGELKSSAKARQAKGEPICKPCGKQFVSNAAYLQHNQAIHATPSGGKLGLTQMRLSSPRTATLPPPAPASVTSASSYTRSRRMSTEEVQQCTAICEICSEDMRLPLLLRQHTREKHTKPRPECLVTFNDVEDAREHFEVIHASQPAKFDRTHRMLETIDSTAPSLNPQGAPVSSPPAMKPAVPSPPRKFHILASYDSYVVRAEHHCRQCNLVFTDPSELVAHENSPLSHGGRNFTPDNFFPLSSPMAAAMPPIPQPEATAAQSSYSSPAWGNSMPNINLAAHLTNSVDTRFSPEEAHDNWGPDIMPPELDKTPDQCFNWADDLPADDDNDRMVDRTDPVPKAVVTEMPYHEEREIMPQMTESDDSWALLEPEAKSWPDYEATNETPVYPSLGRQDSLSSEPHPESFQSSKSWQSAPKTTSTSGTLQITRVPIFSTQSKAAKKAMARQMYIRAPKTPKHPKKSRSKKVYDSDEVSDFEIPSDFETLTGDARDYGVFVTLLDKDMPDQDEVREKKVKDAMATNEGHPKSVYQLQKARLNLPPSTYSHDSDDDEEVSPVSKPVDVEELDPRREHERQLQSEEKSSEKPQSDELHAPRMDEEVIEIRRMPYRSRYNVEYSDDEEISPRDLEDVADTNNVSHEGSFEADTQIKPGKPEDVANIFGDSATEGAKRREDTENGEGRLGHVVSIVVEESALAEQKLVGHTINPQDIALPLSPAVSPHPDDEFTNVDFLPMAPSNAEFSLTYGTDIAPGELQIAQPVPETSSSPSENAETTMPVESGDNVAPVSNPISTMETTESQVQPSLSLDGFFSSSEASSPGCSPDAESSGYVEDSSSVDTPEPPYTLYSDKSFSPPTTQPELAHPQPHIGKELPPKTAPIQAVTPYLRAVLQNGMTDSPDYPDYDHYPDENGNAPRYEIVSAPPVMETYVEPTKSVQVERNSEEELASAEAMDRQAAAVWAAQSGMIGDIEFTVPSFAFSNSDGNTHTTASDTPLISPPEEENGVPEKRTKFGAAEPEVLVAPSEDDHWAESEEVYRIAIANRARPPLDLKPYKNSFEDQRQPPPHQQRKGMRGLSSRNGGMYLGGNNDDMDGSDLIRFSPRYQNSEGSRKAHKKASGSAFTSLHSARDDWENERQRRMGTSSIRSSTFQDADESGWISMDSSRSAGGYVDRGDYGWTSQARQAGGGRGGGSGWGHGPGQDMDSLMPTTAGSPPPVTRTWNAPTSTEAWGTPNVDQQDTGGW